MSDWKDPDIRAVDIRNAAERILMIARKHKSPATYEERVAAISDELIAMCSTLQARCQALEAERDQLKAALTSLTGSVETNAPLFREALEKAGEKLEQLSALQAVLAEIEPYLQHKEGCGWQADDTFDREKCTCGLESLRAGLRGIRQTEDRTAEKTEKP